MPVFTHTEAQRLSLIRSKRASVCRASALPPAACLWSSALRSPTSIFGFVPSDILQRTANIFTKSQKTEAPVQHALEANKYSSSASLCSSADPLGAHGGLVQGKLHLHQCDDNGLHFHTPERIFQQSGAKIERISNGLSFRTRDRRGKRFKMDPKTMWVVGYGGDLGRGEWRDDQL